MASPSQLAIATSSIKRMVYEEFLYRKELKSQEEQFEKLKASGGTGNGDDEENYEFRLKQGEQAIQETKAVLSGPLREKITVAVEKVEGMLNSGNRFETQEVEEAKDAAAKAKGGEGGEMRGVKDGR